MKKSGFVLWLLLALPANVYAYDVTFNQIDWLDNSGGYTLEMSDWGQAKFEFSSADAGMFYSYADGVYGYLNVVTSVSGGGTNNWAVQNSLLCFENADRISDAFAHAYSFDLGITPGTSVTSIDYYFTIESAAFSIAPPGTAITNSVSAEEWLFGGLEGDDPEPFSGNTGQAAPPAAQNYAGAPAGSVPGESGQTAGNASNIPPINEDENGCAPGACARSLKYLENTTGIEVPGSAQDVYDTLNGPDYLDTSVGPAGTGTKVWRVYYGKTLYAFDNDVPVNTRTTKDPLEILEGIGNGADVEIGVYWGKNAAGKSMGGHCAMVTAATVSRDADGNVTGYEVSIVDDAKQGDGNASNDPHKLSFDKDGNLKGYGTGAKLISFWIEKPIPEPAGLSVLGLLLLSARRRRT